MAKAGDSEDRVQVDGEGLTIEKVVRVAREGAKADFGPDIKDRMKKTRKSLLKLVEADARYTRSTPASATSSASGYRTTSCVRSKSIF